MSLSRPATFPLLKLPFLCIEPVIKSWDIFDIIFFALISKRTRQVVRNLKIPLIRIEVYLENYKHIMLGNSKKDWVFKNERETRTRFVKQYKDFSEYSLVLQKNAIPLYTRKTDRSLKSYTYDMNEVTALKMALELLNEVFKCSVEKVWIGGNHLPASGDIGVKSTVNLMIDYAYKYVQNQKLNSFLENLEVIDTCTFYLIYTRNVFYCDPKLFKCKKLEFWTGSAAWVTREILLQFEVAQLNFDDCPFSVEDIQAFVTHWFHSDNKKLEYLYIEFRSSHVLLEKFQTEDLNPLPFSERTRVPSSESFRDIDFSKGLEIVRHDGLQATIHANGRDFLFYIWHNQ